MTVRCSADQLRGRVRGHDPRGLRRTPTGLIVNPGAWTHYSYAIRDALEIFTGPVVEVHLSDIEHREQWRRTR